MYFAKFKESNSEIYIFSTAAARDAWVNYQDQFSRDMGTTSENAFFTRQAITRKQAKQIGGDSFNHESNYFTDEISGNLVLFVQRRESREIKEEKSYKLISDMLEAVTGAQYYNSIENAARRMCHA